jgi:adenylate cyclase
MKEPLSAADATALAASAADWLVGSGLDGSDVPELVAGLCRRLVAGGIALDRAGCAILTLHPQIVSQEVTWLADDDRAATTHYTRQLMEDPANRSGPYNYLGLNKLRYHRFLLSEAGVGADMAVLQRLRAQGYSEYFGFFHATGRAAAVSPFARRVGLVPCVVGSFATRRPGGFGDAEIDCLKSISRTLALAAKSRTNFETGARLLDVYVGRRSGSQVLNGQVTLGDSERISCGIWLCDLRRSSRLVSQLPLDEYVALLNRYFDVTVAAVMQAGGEVLKFIGDAVLGIFPSDRLGNDVEMRERALAAASRAVGDIGALDAPGGPLQVGIALHVGEVMYGNVGTDERLDFTVIGRAVNEVARLQGLTKQLGQPVLASAQFAGPIGERFDFVGAHPVAGFDEMLESYAPRTLT